MIVEGEVKSGNFTFKVDKIAVSMFECWCRVGNNDIEKSWEHFWMKYFNRWKGDTQFSYEGLVLNRRINNPYVVIEERVKCMYPDASMWVVVVGGVCESSLVASTLLMK